MTIQPIRVFGDPVLRTAADPVVDFDKELRTLVADLAETMLDAPGQGLAAPQIGVGLRVFTYHVVGEGAGHLINPVLHFPNDEEQDGPEGCLSIPGLTFDCKRREHVVAHGQNMHGDPVTIEGTAMLARCVQHETDHLDGVLFVDRLDGEARRAAMRAIRNASWFGDTTPTVKLSPHPTLGRALWHTTYQQDRSVRLAFAGTPAAAVPTLQALLASDAHEVVAVITRPASRQGRGRRTAASPVAATAEAAGVPVLTPGRPSEPEFLDTLRALDVDCCPVVAYGALLPRTALDVPRVGWVNLHFSLLPAWRGAAPVQHAVLHGDEVTGASTFLIEEGLDTGPVFGVVTEAIRPDDTSGDLLERLAASGAGLMVATMDGIADGSLVAVPQPAEGVSLAPKIVVADAEVPWETPARHVDRLVRACTPAPGAWTTFRGERLKLGPVRLRGANALAPGEIGVERGAVAIGTATMEVELGTVQPPGKRPMAAADWARGARIEPGERCG